MMNNFDQKFSKKPIAKNIHNLLAMGCVVVLTACGGGGGDGGVKPNNNSTIRPGDQVNTIPVNVSVTGLVGHGLTLQNKLENDLAIPSNGDYKFSIAPGSNYTITVGTQPTGQTCTVVNNTGTNVTKTPDTTVRVTCSNKAFDVSGLIKGLSAGSQITLFNNSSDPIVIMSDGQDQPFKFETPVAFDSSYTVTVVQPNDQICSVSNSKGSGITDHVDDIEVTCSVVSHSISGRVEGLAADTQITLLNNNADPLPINANGTFTFPTEIAHEGGYVVSVGTQPAGQKCTVSNERDDGVISDIHDVVVSCAAKTYNITGKVSGLVAGSQVTLVNNHDNQHPVTVTSQSKDGAFSFAVPVIHNGSYAVTIDTQPVGQICSVMNNSGTGDLVTSTISNIAITCNSKVYAISGSVTGLSDEGKVTLYNNNGDPLTIDKNGRFNFEEPVAYNGSYAVTVATHPFLQKCDITNGAGSGVSADVSTVQVACKSPVMKTVDEFSFENGALPNAGLVQGNDGNLYGMTRNGGQYGMGAIYKIAAGEITRIYSFGGGLGYDGMYPSGTLIVGSDGNFYGTTRDGGKNSAHGTIFKITPEGNLSTLYTFDDVRNGSSPASGLVLAKDGKMYGTTEFGGNNNTNKGTLFRFDPTSAPQTGLTRLYSFSGTSDGAQPSAKLIQGKDGNLYGTTTFGGINNEGTIFKMTLQGELTSLYGFNGVEDGANPSSELMQGSDGNFYGTTVIGGTNNLGTIYKFGTDGKLKTLFTFDGIDHGSYPNAGLVQGGDGNLYGTAWQGGDKNQGTLFSISPQGAFTTLYTFMSSARSSARLLVGKDGGLYGTTQYGGADNAGTVFRYGA